MNLLLLKPDDVLFNRDGRPMSGSLSGNGARIPAPHVISGALHAALHRADLEDAGHVHRHVKDKKKGDVRDRRFGSLLTAGPFFVRNPGKGDSQEWLFPVPLDVEARNGSGERTRFTISCLPRAVKRGASSLPAPLSCPLVSTLPPSKTKAFGPNLFSKTELEAYLHGDEVERGRPEAPGELTLFDIEHTYGIGIDADRQAAAESQFYSSSRLRLKEDVWLGVLATAPHSHQDDRADLIRRLFQQDGSRIVVGGDMRACSVRRKTVEGPLPLPRSCAPEGTRVKWVLLTPAVFPGIIGKDGKRQPGGWLPNWVDPESGEVRLLDGPGAAKAKRLGRPAGQPIRARLVAARLGAPVVVTGWAAEDEHSNLSAGARRSWKAVPEGSVYYFEAADPEQAAALARALQWEGASEGTSIENRRSTLLGEKGYGIGICGPWYPFTSL